MESLSVEDVNRLSELKKALESLGKVGPRLMSVSRVGLAQRERAAEIIRSGRAKPVTVGTPIAMRRPPSLQQLSTVPEQQSEIQPLGEQSPRSYLSTPPGTRMDMEPQQPLSEATDSGQGPPAEAGSTTTQASEAEESPVGATESSALVRESYPQPGKSVDRATEVDLLFRHPRGKEIFAHATLAGLLGTVDDFISAGDTFKSLVLGAAGAAVLRSPTPSVFWRLHDGIDVGVLTMGVAALKVSIQYSTAVYRRALGVNFLREITSTSTKAGQAVERFRKSPELGDAWIDRFSRWARDPKAADFGDAKEIADELRRADGFSKMTGNYAKLEQKLGEFNPEQLKRCNLNVDMEGILAIASCGNESRLADAKELYTACRSNVKPISPGALTYDVLSDQAKTLMALFEAMNHPENKAFRRAIIRQYPLMAWRSGSTLIADGYSAVMPWRVQELWGITLPEIADYCRLRAKRILGRQVTPDQWNAFIGKYRFKRVLRNAESQLNRAKMSQRATELKAIVPSYWNYVLQGLSGKLQQYAEASQTALERIQRQSTQSTAMVADLQRKLDDARVVEENIV